MTQLVFEDFKDHVGSTFTVVDPATTLTLDSVELLPSQFRRPDLRPPFSLLFRGPGEFILPQKLYAMKHAVMGELSLFLVPIGKDQHGVRYEALFN